MKAKREKINKVVKVNDNEITVLGETFEYADGFKGLVGYKFEPISIDCYEHRTKLSEVESFLRDCVSENDIPFKYREHERGCYKNPYKQWAKDIISEGEAGEIIFDTSYSELWDYLREELNLSEDEAYIFNCIGGGRCFSANDKFTHNKELEKYLVYEQ